MIRAYASGFMVAVVSSLLACSGSDAIAPASDHTPPPTNVITTETFGEQHSGDGTYYTFADGSGACLFDKTNDFHIAALNAPDWAGSAWCGACADVTGPSGSRVRVRIVDECGDCAKGQLDFHPDAFAVLAPKERGRIAITWNFVACDAQGPVSYKFKDGSNPYWTAVQVRNSRFPIAKLETSKDGLTFSEAQRQERLQLFLERQRLRRGRDSSANHRLQWRDLDRHLARGAGRAGRRWSEPVRVTPAA